MNCASLVSQLSLVLPAKCRSRKQYATHNENGAAVVSTVFVLLEILCGFAALCLVLALILGLFGANPNAQFASLVYEWESYFMKPFNGLFEEVKPTSDVTIHTSLLFGLFVYVILGACFEAIGRKFRIEARA